MQTTLRINDDTYKRAKAKSGALGISLTRFFEEAVEERLAKLDGRPDQNIVLPVSSISGGALTNDTLRQRIQEADFEHDQKKLH